MKKRIYFQLKLFRYLSISICILAFILATFLYINTSKSLKKNFIYNSNSIINRISLQIDQLYQQMQLASSNVLVNNEIITMLSTLNFESTEEKKNSFKQSIFDNLKLVNSYIPQVTKVAIFNSYQNFYYYFGYAEDSKTSVAANLADYTWYDSLIPTSQNYVLTAPHINPWGDENSRLVISLYRRILNSFSYQYGICEIQLPYDYFKKIFTQDILDSNIAVLNENREIIYPHDAPADEKLVIDSLYNLILPSSKDTLNMEPNYKNYIYTSYKSDKTGWTIINYTTNNALQKDLKTYQITIFSLTFSLLFLFLGFIYYITKKLTYPLQQLTSHIVTTNIDDIPLAFSKDEFVLLEKAFTRISKDLQESTSKVYELKLQSLNAQFLSLQAKMNPHFLYNSLNIISASLDLYPKESTAEMCNQLAELLRYSSGNMEKTVTLKEELEHTRLYLEFSKISYEENLTFNFSIPDEMLDLHIPRLTIQPFVENSIKHGLSQTAFPWNIHISGTRNSTSFDLFIRDSGKGFAPGQLQELQWKMQQYDQNIKEANVSDTLSINGMGILNIYFRLSILSQGYATLEIQNLNPDGCEIHIHTKII